jgi:hypothetical protein
MSYSSPYLNILIKRKNIRTFYDSIINPPVGSRVPWRIISLPNVPKREFEGLMESLGRGDNEPLEMADVYRGGFGNSMMSLADILLSHRIKKHHIPSELLQYCTQEDWERISVVLSYFNQQYIRLISDQFLLVTVEIQNYPWNPVVSIDHPNFDFMCSFLEITHPYYAWIDDLEVFTSLERIWLCFRREFHFISRDFCNDFGFQPENLKLIPFHRNYTNAGVLLHSGRHIFDVGTPFLQYSENIHRICKSWEEYASGQDSDLDNKFVR